MLRPSPAIAMEYLVTEQCRQDAKRGEANLRSGRDAPAQTSKPESPAIGPILGRKGCSAKPLRHSCRLLRECGPDDPLKDAMDKEARVARSRGRSVGELYNKVRPHSSLGYRPPAPETIVWPAQKTVAQMPALN